MLRKPKKIWKRIGKQWVNNNYMIYRIINKVARIIYQAIHPSLWNKHMGVYGIPNIRSYKNIKFGQYCTINPNVYIQSSGGGNFWRLCYVISRRENTNCWYRYDWL